MQSSHILLSNLNFPVLKKSDFFGMGRLVELHINSSNIQTIEPSAFDTINNLKVREGIKKYLHRSIWGGRL